MVGALTAPAFMALTCRWRSRPQHQERKHHSVIGPRSYMPTVIPASSAVALTADHLKSAVVTLSRRNIWGDFSVRLHYWRHCHGIEGRHFLPGGGNHFHHRRRRL